MKIRSKIFYGLSVAGIALSASLVEQQKQIEMAMRDPIPKVLV